jgi:hypothetical protein
MIDEVNIREVSTGSAWNAVSGVSKERNAT